MKTDRQLLELAAKAAGLTTNHKWNAERLELLPPVLALVVHRNGELVSTGWNPHDDDGDALRLAVKLEISFWQAGDAAVADHDALGPKMRESYNGDPYAATRRAIVRAAAAIGEKMK